MKVGDKITDGTTQFIVRKIGGGGQLIKGIIMAFSGTFDSNGYPVNPDTNAGDTGWHICDGTNGTPDLRGRFILGASDGHAVGSTGGEENHTLTAAEMPAHKHTGTTSTNGEHSHGVRDADYHDGYGKSFDSGDWGPKRYIPTSNAGNHNHTFTTDNAGGGAAHNNMPPYYALSYIMKL